jgi:hypothetical protein
LLKKLYTLSGGPLNFEIQGFNLSSQWENPALAIVQYNEKQTNNGTVPKSIDKAEIRVKIYRQSGNKSQNI